MTDPQMPTQAEALLRRVHTAAETLYERLSLPDVAGIMHAFAQGRELVEVDPAEIIEDIALLDYVSRTASGIVSQAVVQSARRVLRAWQAVAILDAGRATYPPSIDIPLDFTPGTFTPDGPNREWGQK